MAVIKLVKPTPEQNTRRYDDKLKRYVGESFDAGERIIMVDGVRWGRTVVTRHGCHGTKHVFKQEGGEMILDNPDARYPHEIEVRSQKRQKWLGEKDNWRPTEERVLDCVKALINDGKLRHPDVVKHEQAEADKRYKAASIRREKERLARFRTRAAEALQINDLDSPLIDRVVAAMEWAQGQ